MFNLKLNILCLAATVHCLTIEFVVGVGLGLMLLSTISQLYHDCQLHSFWVIQSMTAASESQLYHQSMAQM